MFRCVSKAIVGSLLFFGLGIFQCLSIFVYASFGDRTGPQHEETTETSQKDVKNFVECGY